MIIGSYRLVAANPSSLDSTRIHFAPPLRRTVRLLQQLLFSVWRDQDFGLEDYITVR